MEQLARQKEILYSRLRSIESDLSDASRAIGEAESKVASVEASMSSLPSRLTAVRGRGYSAMGHLDKTIELLTKRWTETGPLIKQTVVNSLQPLSPQIRALQGDAQRLRGDIDRGSVASAEVLAGRLSMDALSMKGRTVSEAARVTAPVNELVASLSAIDRDLKVAEKTVELFSQASFPFKQEESPVLAIEGKYLAAEKCDATLYFTNQRFLLEGKKEVVLEKKLFIVTKKRTDRMVMIEQPIGALREIAKGRVGLIAGIGVYIRFRPETSLQDAVFDVKGWEADVITRFFSYIIGGEADRDIATAKGVAVKEAPVIKMVRCPYCGAPHSGEIYRGQTSVKCEYCGSQVAVT